MRRIWRLNMREDEIYGFLGENGAGKSTTLRVVTGLCSATSDKVVVLGLDPIRQRAELHLAIGVLSEGGGFYGWMSAHDSLRWYAQLCDIRLTSHSIIRATGKVSVHGVVVWISLVRVDSGHERPVDLEGWSALKAVTRASVAPGDPIRTEWPMRLIQAGDYRVFVSAVSRGADRVATSSFADFHVRRKPVVESRRILPVALGMPFLMGRLVLVGWARKKWN